MVRRHTRHKFMTDTERERFVREATEAHERLRAYTFALSPIHDDYKAVLRLSLAISRAIRDVSGDDPPWMKTPSGNRQD